MPLYSQFQEVPGTRGLVLSEREHNGYSDSDFYAIVWIPEQHRAEQICWGTTRCASIGHGDNCVVDADDVVRAQYRAAERERLLAMHAKQRAEALARVDTKGATVIVTRGRKVPRGTTGTVLSAREEVGHRSRYGTWTSIRTMLFISNGRQSWHVDAANCDLIAPGHAAAQEAFDAAEIGGACFHDSACGLI